MSIAQTILAQLGGSRFMAMTGAKNFLDCGQALQFDLPARFAKGGINKVRVTLEPSDTYTVSFLKYRPRALDCQTVAEVSEVYADSLRQVFTRETGLDTHL